MPIQVLLASAALSGGVVLLVWTLSAARSTTSRGVSKNLSGERRLTDLRQIQLQRSALQRSVRPALATIARRVRRITPAGRLDKLEERIVLAGVGNTWPIERVLAAKLILGAVGAGLTVLVLLAMNLMSLAVFVVPFGALLGFFTPEIALGSKADERQKSIRRGLPDTIDQVTISVEAGLGFEAALERVTHARPGPISEEFSRTLQEIKLGIPRKDAFRALADRTDVPQLRRFVFAIIQAENYGMPIAGVLRVQADELRTGRRQDAEEQAMKVPIKMLFPLVLFIFPVMFIVLVGPAAIQLARTLFGANV